MALIIADRVKETTITEGTGTITLSGATFGGFQSFSSAIGEGNTTYYCIQNESNFEIGLGTYSSGTLSRDTVIKSSNSDSKISITGVAVVFSVVPASKLIYKNENGDFVISGDVNVDDVNADLVSANSGDFGFILSNGIESSGLLTLTREDAGNFFHAYVDDSNDRTISLYSDATTSPTWKLGLKNSPSSETAPPTHGYIYGSEGSIGIVGNSDNIISISNSSPFTVKHQNVDVIASHYATGTHIQSNSSSYPALIVNGGAALFSDIQRWNNNAGTTLSVVDNAGNIGVRNNNPSYQLDVTGTGNFSQAIRFGDGSLQTTAALPISTGSIIDQNTSDILTQSGYFQTYIDSLDHSALSVSGWAKSYIDQIDSNLQGDINQNSINISTASGALRYSIDQNASNLITQSGYFQTAIDGIDSASVSGWTVGHVDNISGILQNQINLNETAITTVSGLIGDADFLPGISGSLIDQNASNIVIASGALRDSINELDSDITTASGALRGSINQTNTDLATASGSLRDYINQNTSDIGTVSGLLTPSGESFDFIGNILTYNNSDGGSFTADLSSLSTFDTSGVSLAYSAGTLTYTNNAGGSFDVDLSSISGDVYAMIVDGAPSTLDTLNEIAAALNDDANLANTLTTLISTTSGNLQTQITSNDGDITQLNSDITTVSGLLYDDSAVSGYFESRVDSADISTAANSGYFESRVDQADSNIVTVSGLLYDDTAISGYFEFRSDKADSDITTVSGLLYDDAAISGYFESRVGQADSDIATVSGLLDSVTPTGTPSGVGFFDNGGSLSGNSSFTYDGASVRLFGNIDVSGISTFGSGVKTPLRTEADGATITFDMDQSNNYTAELGGNRTLAVSNVDVGQKFTIRLTQDSVGSRVPTWWGGITWLTSGGSDPTLKTGAGEIDYFGFISTSGGYYEGFHLTEVATGGGGSSTLTVKEADGTPNVSNVSTIVVSNGTLTNDGGGQVTITTGGGGGGSYDDTYVSGVSTFASGLAIQNQADIATVSGLLYDDTAISGYFESRVDTNETQITAVSGWAQSYVDSQDHSAAAVSGALQPQITSNDADIAYISGIAVYGSGQTLQSVTDNGATTNNAIVISNTLEAETVLADIDGPIILECKNDTGSTINAGTPVYVSGYFSTNGKALIAPAVGNDPTKMPAIGLVADNLTTGTEGHVHVFGLATGFDTSTFTVGQTVYVDPTASGLTNIRPTGINELVQNMGRVLRSDASQGRVLLLGPGRTNDVPNSGSFEILTATTGNFEHMNLTSDDTVPTFTFTGSGVNDTPINLEVRSSLMSATGSGTALLFQGTQGQLFSITDNLSSGTIFNVSDITGLPMLEVTASGDVEIGEFADNITIHQPVLLSGGVPSNTTNKLYNNNGTLYFNGSTLGYDDTAISGYFESRVNQADIDIATVSGLLYDDTYISGVATFASGLAVTNETNITANSGYFEDNILELVGVSGIDITSAGSTVNISAGSLSGYFENHHITTAATSSSNNTGSTFIQGVLLDSYGHVTGINTAIVPDTDTTYTAGTGLSLVGTTFNTAGTGNFTQLTFDNENVQIGTDSYAISSGISIGYQAGSGYLGSNTDNIFIGKQAGAESQSNSFDSLCIGEMAGYDANVSESVCLGVDAGKFQYGTRSVFIGYDAGSAWSFQVSHNTYQSIGIGGGAMFAAVGAHHDICFGNEAGRDMTGDANFVAGQRAGYGITGDRNVEIRLGSTTSSIIGSNSDKLHIQNTIIGDTSSKLLAIGNVGSTDLTPDATLEVKPNATTDVGIIVQAVASHSVNLQEWQDSSEVSMLAVGPDGGLEIPDNVPATTTNKLYNNAGTLTFNGSAVGGGGGSSYTAGSGLTLSGTEFNVYGGSGNFEYIELTTNNTVVPKIEFTGSGVTDTPIRMKVLSSHASASTSGTALSFEGTQGQLFGITDNLSSGTIFSVNDITGLPMIEVDASGDVKVGRFANSVVLYSPSVNGSVQGDLNVTGAFSATTKSFLIDHPSKEGMRLQYASLEGPENGVYVRGTTDEGFITLPDYWRDLVHNSSITVTLTPVGQFQPLFVEQKNNREIRVGGVCGYYDYVVYGERKDVDKLEVEW